MCINIEYWIRVFKIIFMWIEGMVDWSFELSMLSFFCSNVSENLFLGEFDLVLLFNIFMLIMLDFLRN